MSQISSGSQVKHPQHGNGTVEFARPETAIVRFEHGLEECEISDLTAEDNLYSVVDAGRWQEPGAVITKCQAAAISSVNDAWGVFARSRIALLPHQLWVCNRVTREWPTRYLIADDVGLGKTIEAGLILWPLISKGLVKRFLILCPASLVEQWQVRLREMFDIRVARYTAEADTNNSDFWGTHSQVVASLSTLREDRNGRHDRMLHAEPWDLVLVDEAHHLYADKSSGGTLGYRLVEKLLNNNQINSCIFFTGTPHRGKPHGFWALMALLRPDLFDPRKKDHEQIPLLRQAFVRNNKSLVTDMKGKKLFKPVKVFSETFTYSAEEEKFYQLMTEFIADGKAYATSLESKERSQVVLVLIAMQKLASSSVASIRSALNHRLRRLRSMEKVLHTQLQVDQTDYQTEDPDLWDESLASNTLKLMQEEIPHLEELLHAAEAVESETKIGKIIDVVEERFHGRQVLFFTEYKATQALLMSALMERYGEQCVTFINGEGKLDTVLFPNGLTRSVSADRQHAANQFNQGKVPYLVSTEAAGEGIDLQHRCYSLIHVDLPWNPMRLHQRVGRLYRYGQQHAVEVVTLRNPHTVESRIWDLLNQKLESISAAMSGGMDDPEDMLQLVLGMAAENTFSELFSEAKSLDHERLDHWFDQKTATLGGKSSLETVKSLVGNAARFDISDLGDVPDIDLPDLRPFFVSMLSRNQRRILQTEDSIEFKTPDIWRTEPGIQKRYEGLIFKRSVEPARAGKVIGVGHKVFDKALEEARSYPAMLARCDSLESELLVVEVYDRLTGVSGPMRKGIVGVQQLRGPDWLILRDWELLKLLNSLNVKSDQSEGAIPDRSMIDDALDILGARVNELKFPFKRPEFEPLALICQ